MARRRMPLHRAIVSVLVASALLAACADSPSLLDDYVAGPPADTEVAVDDAPDGVRFVDDDGHYSLTIDPAWERLPDMVLDGVEFWLVEARPGFGANVNVLTEPLPFPLGLAAYLDASVENAPMFISDFSLIDERIVDTAAGKLATVEFTGTEGGRSLHFLQAVMVEDERAVVATLTTPLDVFDRLRDRVEPYLLTLGPA